MSKLLYLKNVSEIVGVSTSTINRWIKDEKIPAPDRDRNNWRVYDEETVDKIKQFANKITPAAHKIQSDISFKEKSE